MALNLAGLAHRLSEGTLRADEREVYARIEQMVALEEEKLTLPKIAARMQTDLYTVKGWRRTKQYTLFRKAILERSAGLIVAPNAPRDAPAREHARRMQQRLEWNTLTPEALRFFKRAFRVYPAAHKEAGEYVNPGAAERAAYKVAESQGLTTPEVQAGPREVVAPGIIQAKMQAIAAADRRETVVRVTVGDTHVDIASRPVDPSGETGELA